MNKKLIINAVASFVKKNWQQQNPISESMLYNLADGIIRYYVEQNWDFIENYEEEADEVAKYTDLIMDGATQVENIIVNWLKEKYKLTIEGKDIKNIVKQSWQVVTYNIQEVSFEQFKSMHMGDEGLVALGAGGDLKQWIDGITGQLNDEGIASGDANTLFKAFFKLTTTEGRTDLVMVFNPDADMDLGKMAMWRLQWGGALSWISDWFDNYASHYASMDWKKDKVITVYQYSEEDPLNKEAWMLQPDKPSRAAYPEAHAIAKDISKTFSVILEAWKYEGEENPEGHTSFIDPMTAGYRVVVAWPKIEGTEDSMETDVALLYMQQLLDERGYKGTYPRTGGSGGGRMFVMVPYNIGKEDDIIASLKFSWLDSSNIHQELMDSAYDSWQGTNWSKEEFLDKISPEHKDAVILGNLNYQVGNGGFGQWYGNGYGTRDGDYLIAELLPKIDTDAAIKVLKMVGTAIMIHEEVQEYDEYDDAPMDDDPYDYLDDRYYEINDQFMLDVNDYLANIRNSSLKFSWQVVAVTFEDYINQDKIELGDYIEMRGYPAAFVDELDYKNRTIGLQYTEDGPINSYSFDELASVKMVGNYSTGSLNKRGWQLETVTFGDYIDQKKIELGDYIELEVYGPAFIEELDYDNKTIGLQFTEDGPIGRWSFDRLKDIKVVENYSMGSLEKRSWELQAPTIYNVKARSYERAHPNIPSGEEMWEEIDILDNELFKDSKNVEDIKRMYESFWNDLNPSSDDIVKVIEIVPVKESKLNKENKMKKQSDVKSADMNIDEKGKLVEDGETQKFRQDLIEEQIPTGEVPDENPSPKERYESSPETPSFDDALQTYRGDKMDNEFLTWFDQNKDSDLLWGEYNNYVQESSSLGDLKADSFNVWMRGRFDALYSSQMIKNIIKQSNISFVMLKQLVVKAMEDYKQSYPDEISEEDIIFTKNAENADDVLSAVNGWFGGGYEDAAKFILDSIVIHANKNKGLKKEASQKQSNGIAVNILPSLFEDKFPVKDIPRELMLLRSKAKQALTGISKKLTLSDRDATPADFPVEWLYKNAGAAGPALDYSNYVTEVRAQLQDIINYGNSITGENFYAGMETTIYKISRAGEKGVKILREKIDGKINRYGYINEKGTFVVLPNHRELRKTSKLQRPDTGENLTIISYEDFSLGSAASMVEELMQKKSWEYENPQDIEAQEEAAENPYADISEDTSGDDVFTYIKERYNKIKEQVDNVEMNINRLQTEVNEHIATWPEKAQQKITDVMTSIINHELIKEAFGETDAEVGSPEWVDVITESASNLDYDMSKRKGEDATYITDLLLDAAKGQGVEADSSIAVEWYDKYVDSPFYAKHVSRLEHKTPKYAIDISDEIPPMGWNTSDPGKPAGSGAPMAPLQSLQDDEDAKPQDANVLYDSKKDTGPQYQITMNPKDKEVSIKFMDSPEREALEQTIQEDTSVPQVTPLDQLPKLNTEPSAGGVQEGENLFKAQDVPVAF